jgi:hypothetical protein
MTWKHAQEEAQKRIAQLPLPPTGRLDGLEVNLLDFDSDAVCMLLTGEQPVIFHKTVIRAIKRDLEKRGASVFFRMVPLADTIEWKKARPPA